MSRNVNDVWRRLYGSNSSDDENADVNVESEDIGGEPRLVHFDEPRPFIRNFRDDNGGWEPTRPARGYRAVTVFPDGRQQASEEYVESTLPIAAQRLNLQQAQQDNQYRLDSQRMAYNLRDNQDSRQHEETMKHIEQIPELKEMELREKQQKFEQQQFLEGVRERNVRDGRIFQANLMKHGMNIMKQRQEIFELFGFTKEDATRTQIPRLSEPITLISRVGYLSTYVYSMLATGVDEINENVFAHSITFVDGTRMKLPNAHEGYKCTFSRVCASVYLIHVSKLSKKRLRKDYPGQYLASLICCDNKCNVQ